MCMMTQAPVSRPVDMYRYEFTWINSKGEHTLDFKCSCTRCTRLKTITMQDRDFLREMGIAWKRDDETQRTR